MSSDDYRTVLAVDTSTNQLRLALQYENDRLVKWSGAVEQSHGQIIMKQIGDLLDSAGVTPGNLDGFVVCVGPGSFTGLRIGLAAVKGMAMALDRPVAAVTSFEIAAACLSDTETAVAVVIPLNRDEGIMGLVENGQCDLQGLSVVRYSRLAEAINGRAMAGMGLDLAGLFPGLPNEDLSDRLEYDAGDLLRLGRQKLLAGLSADIAELEPLYLQRSQAEIRFERRQQKN